MDSIEGVVLTPLKIIEGETGSVMHALKVQDATFSQFGEAYFSTVNENAIKGWKKHARMVLNLIVPVGIIKFVLFDGRINSPTYKNIQEIVLSKKNYQRLTVPPGVWMAFQGKSPEINILLNLASIQHDPEEAENLPVINQTIPYKDF